VGNQRHLEDYIDLLVESFKQKKNLPYKIKSGRACPDKNEKKNCRKKHGEIIVKITTGNKKSFMCFIIQYTIQNQCLTGGKMKTL